MAYLFGHKRNKYKGESVNKSKRRSVFGVLAILLVALLLTGCQSQSNIVDPIVGRWENAEGLIAFNQDGSFSSGSGAATKTVQGASYRCGNDTLTFSGISRPLGRFGFEDEKSFSYDVSDDTLILESMEGIVVSLTKVK